MTRKPTRKPKPRGPSVRPTRRRRPVKPQRHAKATAIWRASVKKPMRALVTGGAGFIGSHLCDRLLADGYEVLAVDNLSTGTRENLQHLKREARFHFIEHDVVKPYDTAVDRIFNLACPASPVHYQADPIKTWKASIFGAIHALELARKYHARVLQASTSEVYGEPAVHPQVENYWGNVNPIGIRACYDEGKRAAETLFFDYGRRYATDIRVCRIFNTYGPRMLAADGRVVSNFIVQALQHAPLTVYGDGSQTRSFCYVDDLVDGMVRLMASDRDRGPINLGNPGEFTVVELAQKVLALTGSSSPIVAKPLPADDPTRRRPDITLAREKLGWSPKVQLEEGLEKTIAYFKLTLV